MKLLTRVVMGAMLGLSANMPLATSQDIDASGTRGARDDKRGQSEFYDPDIVQSVYLQILESDEKKMLAALPELIQVPATFRWKDTTIPNVAVRFKGNSSSHPNQKHKRSYLVKFSEYDKDLRFLGLRRVSFDNGVQFGSLFSEPIITEILRAEGISTHRCNYAKLHVNDQYQGVYVNVERIDESFIDQHFSGSEGGLWKNDTGGPGGDLQFIGDNPKNYAKAFETKNRAAKKDWPKLVDFIRLINQTPPEEFAPILQAKMTGDNFLRVTAVMLLSGAFDQLTGWGPHNFYLYHDAPHDQWHYLPWDLDVGFCEVAFGRVYVLEDWNAAWPAPAGRQNPLLERIIANPKLLARYRELATEILEKHFQPEQLCRRLDAKYQLIKRDLETDPFPSQRVTVPTDRSYDDIVDSMKTFVRKRYESAKQQLANPGQRPRPTNRPGHGTAPGVPPELAARVQQVTQRAQAMQKKLQEISNIMNQIGPLIQQGKIDEANKLLEQALTLTE